MLARDLHGKNNRLLLCQGAILDYTSMRLLNRMGINAIYVHNPDLEDVTVEDVIAPQLRTDCQDSLKKAMHGFQSQAQSRKISVDTRAVENTTSEMVDQLMKNRKPVAAMMEIRDWDDRLFSHSVNCAVLATMMARKLKVSDTVCQQLAMGMIFHDCGQMFLPVEIVEKKGRLLAEERKILQKHARLGFQKMLQGEFLSPMSSYVVLRHHERIDGTGYPDGIPGEELHIVAKIAAIAEAFDSMTSARAYNRPVMPDRAVRQLLQQAGTAFDTQAVLALVQHIAVYPTGSAVQLNTGEVAIVTATSHGNTTRPTVRPFFAPSGERIKTDDIDLNASRDQHIVRSAVSITELKSLPVAHWRAPLNTRMDDLDELPMAA